MKSLDFSPPAWREDVPSVSFIHINISVQPAGPLFYISASDDESELLSSQMSSVN